MTVKQLNKKVTRDGEGGGLVNTGALPNGVHTDSEEPKNPSYGPQGVSVYVSVFFFFFFFL